jgi:hypothetical protein
MRYKIIIAFFIFAFFFSFVLVLKANENHFAARQFYLLRIYHLASKEQETIVDNFLQNAYLPALHKKGIKSIGVFKPVGNDTAADRRIFVLIPYNSLDQFVLWQQQLQKDTAWMQAGKDYVNAAYNQPAFTRMETILLHAFEGMPEMKTPQLETRKSERIYELRSYEGAGEKLYQNKVQMFNKGDEIGIFKRLGFNAVFYAEVIAGSHMPNLMYMTTFNDLASRNAHWKAFGSDSAWKKLSSMPEYQHNVSKSDILYLTPANYSDY